MSERVKQAAIQEAQHVQHQAKKAVGSGTYIYPIRGIFYFLTHRSLWKPLLDKLTPTISLGIGVTAFCFIFLYLPQAAVLTIFNGPLAVLTTILLTLSEASTLTTVLSRTWFLDDALIDTFDGTLLTRNMTALVKPGRELKTNSSDPVGKLGKLLTKPFSNFTPQALLRYFLYLPLNFIPIVGTVVFIVMQARKLGPTHHARYFQLKGWNARQREKWIDEHIPQYTAFGVPAVLLELLPFIGIFFSFTNAVGAALWVAELEGRETTARELKAQAQEIKGRRSTALEAKEQAQAAQRHLEELAEQAEVMEEEEELSGMSKRHDLRKRSGDD
ncbi:hypothetical protein P152DRAFT_422072 [Eremomyces bilateralis CBS 781.70]|uniref:Outer spore wall protein RRT8 n=1 Tax=Eremomyces bilateralis CBS 781.70 TaxID=1392243 RepID=A0A6G1FWB7_9PEZI|nr:uncharacterized protein P152DRAFT_422072 [Eremomyces bilateralis CBS 781.70]KAF1809986.1 hypothetical protein P152DRAFT_422072 [Eremomyces bilateralis CBS 781.70]